MKGKEKGGGSTHHAPNEGQVHTKTPGDLMTQLPADAREAIDALRQHGPRIVERLNKDDKMRELFIRDPISALHEIGIDVPTALMKYARPNPGAPEALQPPTIRLPNGQLVTANVRIRFTDGGTR